jgi:hypothetical protein
VSDVRRSNPPATASISLDVDNLWSYLKTHGDDWQSRPSYLDTFLPYALDLLGDLDLKLTFFLVGVDAAIEENREPLSALGEAGHEIGNHSFEHEPWLHLYEETALESEISRAHDAIRRATGVEPIGFRGPGFSWSPALLKILSELGYCFDASTLPTFLGPLARAYYFRTSNLSADEKERRRQLFGKFADGLRPVKPYLWHFEGAAPLLEIPVTTMPILRTPFHLSYLLYVSRFSERLAMSYLRAALLSCRLTRTEPSFLLHPLDIIGGDRVRELRFFPGMDVPSDAKRALFIRVLQEIGRSFEIVPMGEHARRLLERGGLPSRNAA